MSGVWLSFAMTFLSLFFAGIAIKLMDDFLDADFDVCRGHVTLSTKLGRGSLPYSFVFLIVGAYFNLHVVIAVFLGSYAMGMVSIWQQRLPSRLPAYIEIALAIVLAIALVGWQLTLWAVAMMAVIDWLDDVVDVTNDELTLQRNIVTRLGLGEALLLILVALAAAVVTNPTLTALTFIAVTAVTVVAEATTTRSLTGTVANRGEGV